MEHFKICIFADQRFSKKARKLANSIFPDKNALILFKLVEKRGGYNQFTVLLLEYTTFELMAQVFGMAILPREMVLI